MAPKDFLRIVNLLSKSQKLRLLTFAFLRVLSNLLDIAALAGIALLATAFSSYTSTVGSVAPIDVPILGSVVIGEREAVLIALGVASLFLVKSIFSIFLQLSTTLTVAEIETSLAERLTREFFRPSRDNSGRIVETVSKFQSNILVSSAGIANTLNAGIGLVTEASLALALIAVFIVVNPAVTAATLLYFGIVLGGLNYLMNYRIKRNSYRIVEGSQGSLTSSRDLFGVRKEVLLAGESEGWIQKIISAKRLAAFSTGLNFVLTSLPRYFLETALVMGLFSFLGGVILFSDLASQAVTVAVFLAGGLRLVAAILPLQLSFNGIIAAAATAREALEILYSIPGISPIGGGSSQFSFDADANPVLTFNKVTFSYGSGAPAISNVSFEVSKNTKTAIVGPSGAGKSTIFDIATGFRVPTSGDARIGNQAIGQMLDGAAGQIGMVPQRSHLISGTLAENVSLVPLVETDLEKASRCMREAGLESFVQNGSKDLEIEVTPDAGQLSGGEIQRLGLARALYRDPKILFLDEATSALDAETESKISKVLDSLRSKMTVVLIAHRLSTVMNADKIIYLDKGKVVAQGTFAELKKQVPDFAKAVQLMDLGE